MILPKLSDSNICQHIRSRIYNTKKDRKDLKRYDGNDSHWLKVKENWVDAIYAAQYDFILNSRNVPPDELELYACNTSDLADGYIFNILDLNTIKIKSHQFRNALERFCKQDPNGKGSITDVHGTRFSIPALYETTTHTYSYRQLAFQNISVIKFFDRI